MVQNIVNLNLSILDSDNFEYDETIIGITNRYEKIRSFIGCVSILDSDGGLTIGYDDNLIIKKGKFRLTGLPLDYGVLIENDSGGKSRVPYIIFNGKLRFGTAFIGADGYHKSFMSAFPTSDPMYEIESLYKKNLNNFLFGDFFIKDTDKLDFLVNYLDYELTEFQAGLGKREFLNVLESEYNNNIMKYSDRTHRTLRSLEEASEKNSV